ncbi:septum formation protein Maf [Planomicrobium chinense]|uniref:Maf family protein n=1 Tax=Planococcus chinensis TaxID=272917 RepID=UPI001CC44B73|nr:Maf family protein [Planococcus chinensis]MBZ5201218.1 septum formation protein Maf [Planococcus chinensis]
MKFKANAPVILASASPRRKELLESLGIEFSIVPSSKEEPDPSKFQTAMGYVIECALLKAKDVAKKHPEAVVIGSDTVVVLDGEILRKPQNKEQAQRYLRQLSGETHDVITAVTIVKGGSEQTFQEITRVTFYDLPETWIEAYTSTEDPYDKAGAYGIQTMSGLFVRKIDGDYNTVVGFPLASLTQKLMLSGFISLEGSHVHAD